MNLYDRNANAANRIGNRYRRMGISAGIEHNTVIIETRFMKFVDEFPFHIRLVIVQLDVGVALA